MHPLNSNNFGSSGIAVTFYNGAGTVTGYIVKQLSQNRFLVTDGEIISACFLSPTTEIALAINSDNSEYCAIQVYTQSDGSGATFISLYHASVITPWNNTRTGTGYFIGDVIRILGPSNLEATVTSVDVMGAIMTVEITEGGDLSGVITPVPSTFISGGTSFQGSTLSNLLTVISMTTGTIMAHQMLLGASVPGATIITSQLSGTPGGAGVYQLNHPVGTIGAEAMTSHGIGSLFKIGYVLDSILVDTAGAGYSENDTIVFTDLIGDVTPTAYISSVDVDGAALAVTTTPGSNITRGEDSLDVYRTFEQASNINEHRVATTTGNIYKWHLGGFQGQSAMIKTP